MTTPTVIVFDLGDELTSGTITEWFVSEGDVVRAGQRLLEVEADKATVEVLASVDGVVLKVARSAGTDIERGDELGWIGDATSESAVVEQAFRLRIHAPCPACGSPVAINGPWLDATCARCGFQAPLEAPWWNEALALAARGKGFSRMLCGPWRLVVHGERGAPSCHNCDAELPVSAQSPMHIVICGRCGLSHAAAPPPPWLSAQDPTIVRVVGDGANAVAPRPTACSNCSTPVHPHCVSSVPRCSQCGRDVVASSAPPQLPRSWAVMRSALKS